MHVRERDANQTFVINILTDLYLTVPNVSDFPNDNA